jgi:hypothetical protein
MCYLGKIRRGEEERKMLMKKSGTNGSAGGDVNHDEDSSTGYRSKQLTKLMVSRARRATLKAQRRRDKSACSRCGARAVPGKPMCERHAEQRHKEAKKRYRKRTAPENRRLCVDCGKNPRYPELTRCMGCNEHHNERVRKSRRSPKTGSTQLHLALTS